MFWVLIGILCAAMAAATIWVELEHRKEQKILKDQLEKQKGPEQENQEPPDKR